MRAMSFKSAAATLTLALGLAAPAGAAKLRVVATVPDLLDMANRIGGEHVSAESLARGSEDIHQISLRPSFVVKLNKADAVIMLGLGIEHSFLPGLLEAAVNPKARWDQVQQCAGPACVDCSKDVHVLQKAADLSREYGELHAMGNPHYNIGPQNGAQMARNVAAGLSRLDPSHKADYEKNLAAYVKELDEKLAAWKKAVTPLKGLKAVSYHNDIVYLEKFTGLEFVGTVELKPGIAPTPTHLEALVKTMKERGVTLIVREQHFENKSVDWLAERTGAKVAIVGTMANSLPGAKTWAELQQKNLDAILAAAGKGGP
jgi:zinc/manganese transport system substrate-binding protein